VYEGVMTALARGVDVRLTYCDHESLELQSAKVSPYRLLLDGARWYLIGRSSVHRGLRVFALAWVERVELTDEPALIPPRFDLEKFLGLAWSIERGEPIAIWLRFSPRAALDVRERQWHPTQRLEPREDGGLDMYMSVDGDEVLAWILGFADQVEVLAPSELRERVCELCQKMAVKHEFREANHADEYSRAHQSEE
jgi:proteasome accessory factor B